MLVDHQTEERMIILSCQTGKRTGCQEVFRDTAINATTEGHKHLGAALGPRSFLEEYVREKVDEWVNEVTKLADFAILQPQASYMQPSRLVCGTVGHIS